MTGLNKVMLIGRLGRDPELHYTPDGTPVTSFSLAVQPASGNGGDGDGAGVQWVNVVAWRRMAELCNRLLHKDERVYLEGSLHTRCWQDGQGNQQFRTEVVATDLIPLDDGLVGS